MQPCSCCSAGGRVANSDASRRKASTVLLSRFVRDRKSKANPEHLVLLMDGPRASKAEALAQPQYGLSGTCAVMGLGASTAETSYGRSLIDEESAMRSLKLFILLLVMAAGLVVYKEASAVRGASVKL